MKLLELSTRTVIEVNTSYGARLIEQGKAVIPPESEPEKAAEPESKAEEKPAPQKKGKRK